MFLRNTVLFLTVAFLLQSAECYSNNEGNYDDSSWFTSLDNELRHFNRLGATIAWDMATGNMNLSDIGTKVGVLKTIWRNTACDTEIQTEKETVKRMMYLLCRGPKYTKEQAKKISQLLDKLSDIYLSSEVCVDRNTMKQVADNSDNNICLKGEPDLELMMARTDLSAEQLLWIWYAWHDTVGPRIKQYYPELVKLMNLGAVKNGYSDIGEIWREEMEIENLEYFSRFMYEQIEPLYVMLHAVVRHKLIEKYGPNKIRQRGKIPVHLLGNMWAQDWSSLINLFYPEEKFNLNKKLADKKWNPKKMVEIAEDFYISLGLPKMTEKFWEYSKIEKTNASMCHGSAANMFDQDDYRMLLCAEPNMEDFYVIHHEMGHIEYYMAYDNLPAIFQDGANSAFQESIGDSIMTAVMVPQHLHRLGLITDEQLFNESSEFDEMVQLHQALSKIPQISYALLLDLYRWDIFKGKIKPNSYNTVFWNMNEKMRGIEPPETRDRYYFDAGAKFHVSDNTPYIRYFWSSFIQADIFKSLCQFTVYGKITNEPLPFPLHRCDIYGSRAAGKELKKFMSKGASQHWSKSYESLTGRNYISYKAILEYYKPIQDWLKRYISKHNIPVGW